MFNRNNALGCDDSHVASVALGDKAVVIHKQLVHPLSELIDAAAYAGFTLGVASAFRGFGRQQFIWDAKASGDRPVLDELEAPIVMATLAPSEQVRAILRWSALPGASRHHWGSDFDIYDAGALPIGQSLALTVGEANSLFANFYSWLEEYLVKQNDFSRPYLGGDQGAVASEPWHLSYLPLARQYEKVCDFQALRHQLIAADIQLIDDVLEQLPEIYERYVAAYFQ